MTFGRRQGRLVLLIALAVILLLGTWVGRRGMAARDHLASVQEGVADIRDALADGDPLRARALVDDVRRHASEAHRLTSDPVWRVVSALPLLGDSPRAVAEVADVADGLANDTLPRALDASDAFDPEALRPAGDRVDLDAVRALSPPLADVSGGLTAALRRVEALDGLRLLPPVRSAVDELHGQLTEVTTAARDAATAARLLPPILGQDGPRRYFLAFQNNAEARGTGGLLGAYGILEADRGRVRLVRVGSASSLDDMRRLPLDFGPAYRRRYGDDPALWVNSNMSPHFPYAADLWLALWQRQTGRTLDGVIATDPVALGYVLDATGPVRLPDGTRVTADNAARLTMSEVYARFSGHDEDEARDAYLQQVATAAFGRLVSGHGSTSDLLDALRRAASERRLLVSSTRADEQRSLARTVVGGVLPDEPGPQVAVVTNNLGGNKLDYYLERSVRYQRLPCLDDRQPSRVRLTLRSAAPPTGLPPYVVTRTHRGAATGPEGSNRVRVSVFLPVGARLAGATLDGRRVLVRYGAERGHPTVDFTLELAPGQAATAVLDLDEPARAGRGEVIAQPLVRPLDLAVTTSDEAARCGS